MAYKNKETDIVEAHSFLGLLAGEGQIPGRSSSPVQDMALAGQFDAAWKAVTDVTATAFNDSDFFDLMVDARQMRAEQH